MTPAARSATSLVKTPQSISPCRGGLIKLIRTRVQGRARPGGAIQPNGAESAQSTQAPSCQRWGHFSHPSPPASCTCFALTRGGACTFAQAHTHGTVSMRARLARARLRGWARQRLRSRISRGCCKLLKIQSAVLIMCCTESILPLGREG